MNTNDDKILRWLYNIKDEDDARYLIEHLDSLILFLSNAKKMILVDSGNLDAFIEYLEPNLHRVNNEFESIKNLLIEYKNRRKPLR